MRAIIQNSKNKAKGSPHFELRDDPVGGGSVSASIPTAPGVVSAEKRSVPASGALGSDDLVEMADAVVPGIPAVCQLECAPHDAKLLEHFEPLPVKFKKSIP